MSSILDTKQLNIDNFEGCIAVGMTIQQMMTMFDKKSWEMDEWCKENYRGHNFACAYEMVRQAVYMEFLDTVKELGYRGNPSALNIINTAINSHAADNVVKIVFDNNLKEENDGDKEEITDR